MIQSGYDVMQVCLNGHQISDMAASFPENRKPYCPTCGAETITACPECNAPIQGFYHVPGVFTTAKTPIPNNCSSCGTAYPWRQAAIASAIELMEMEFDGQELTEAIALVKAVSIETPRTEVSAIKLRRMLSKLGKPIYDVAIKVISDIASQTAKKTLGL